MVARNVASGADRRCQHGIGLGAGDQLAEALVGQFRAVVAGKFASNLGAAAIDQNVGHVLADMGTARYGEQMVVAAVAGDRDDVGIVELKHVAQDRRGDLGRRVVGELAGRGCRDVLGLRQAFGQAAAGPQLDVP